MGFEYFGNVRNDKIADHALIFMLRSAASKGTLPISINFYDIQTTSVQLQCCINVVVNAAKDAGLIVVTLICDGVSTNKSAINALVEDTKKMKEAETIYLTKISNLTGDLQNKKVRVFAFLY